MLAKPSDEFESRIGAVFAQKSEVDVQETTAETVGTGSSFAPDDKTPKIDPLCLKASTSRPTNTCLNF